MTQEPYLPLIWRVIAPYRRRAAVVLLLVLLDTVVTSAAIGLVLPIFQALLSPEVALASLARRVPALAELTFRAQMLVVSVTMILLFLAKAAMSVWSIATSRGFSEQLRLHWILRLGHRYLLGTYASVQREKHGAMLNNWFNETGVASRFFAGYLTYLSSSVLAAAMVVLGLLVSWPTMLAFLAMSAVSIYLLRHRAFGYMSRLGTLKLRLHQGISATMSESLNQIRDLKTLTAEDIRIQQIEDRARDLKSVLVRIGVMGELPRIAGESLAVIALLLFLLVSVVLTNSSTEAFLPKLAFFFVAFYRMMTAGMQAMGARMKALSDLHSVRVIDRLLESQDVLEDRKTGLPLERLESEIAFRNVSFRYEGSQPIVANLDLVIPQGRFTYLIGPSGAGKSTLLDLLLRLQRPTGGSIVAGGRDISEFNLLQWRRQFGYVSQDAALFNGSIRMNLLLAKPDASEEQVHTACRLAGAHDFIQGFPEGYDTLVGDRGHTVSGGQRKRIAIARALITRPAVLILDEATTSFEQSLERDMIRSLKEAMPELTAIQVTHRLQSVVDADWVIAMQAGRIVACGPWQDVERILTIATSVEPAMP